MSEAIAPVFQPAGFGTWEASGSLVSGLVAKEVVVATMSQIFVGGEQSMQVPDRIDPGADLLEAGRQLLGATAQSAHRLVGVFSLGLLNGASTEVDQAGQMALGRVLQREFTQPAALAFLVYVLLYVPCVATLGALRAEFGLRWALFAATYQTLVAWLAATGVYQIARLVMPG